MGDMADDAEAKYWEAQADLDCMMYHTSKEERYWKDRDGNEHLVQEMDDNYLANCDRVFSRYDLSDDPYREIMLDWVKQEIKDRSNK